LIPHREDGEVVEWRTVVLDRRISIVQLLSAWPIEMAVLRRSMGLWLVGRLALAVLLLLSDANPVVLHPKASLVFASVVGLLSWLDTRRRNEDLLLANLGTPRRAVYLFQFGPALGLEFLIAVIGRL
jgi:hypothetical protein